MIEKKFFKIEKEVFLNNKITHNEPKNNSLFCL